MVSKEILISIKNLKKYFPLKKSSLIPQEQLYVKANDGINIDIYKGETLGIVGESGCGKSTFGRVILQLYSQTDGTTMYYGRSIDELAPKYVENTLINLQKYINKYKKAQISLENIDKKFSVGNESSSAKFTEHRRNIVIDRDKKFLDVIKIIGGFIISNDIKSISKALLKEYYASSRLFIQKQILNNFIVEADILPSSKLTVKIEHQKKVIEEKQKILDLAKKNVNEMREKQKNNPEFSKYEKYRDDGIDLSRLEYREMRLLRRDLQIIFQDPYSSLNPRMTVGQIISEGLLSNKFFGKGSKKMQEYIIQVMQDCGLSNYMIHRYPHQFSGGQRQRIGIARSLAVKPKFVVCDEAVSALDVSIQSQIINLLQDLKEKENLTYLFISHDLSVVKYISDRIGVMYLGNIIELSPTDEIFENPLHPYTIALLSAIPTTDLDVKVQPIILDGNIPSPIKSPTGCKFHTRCYMATEKCKNVIPEFLEKTPGHFVSCHYSEKNQKK